MLKGSAGFPTPVLYVVSDGDCIRGSGGYINHLTTRPTHIRHLYDSTHAPTLTLEPDSLKHGLKGSQCSESRFKEKSRASSWWAQTAGDYHVVTFTHDLVCHHRPYLYHMKGSDPGDGALQDKLQRRPTQISVWRRAAATALRALKRFVRN